MYCKGMETCAGFFGELSLKTTEEATRKTKWLKKTYGGNQKAMKGISWPV